MRAVSDTTVPHRIPVGHRLVAGSARQVVASIVSEAAPPVLAPAPAGAGLVGTDIPGAGLVGAVLRMRSSTSSLARNSCMVRSGPWRFRSHQYPTSAAGPN